MSLDFGIVIYVNEALHKKGGGDYIVTMKSNNNDKTYCNRINN